MNAIVEKVILVDEQDRVLGECEKMLAHQNAWCHRAFSIFVFRKQQLKGIEFLLQQREQNKYHCGGLWTNTCCSHPRPTESVLDAAHRRLKEEMNIQLPLVLVSAFHYVAHFENGLTENEYDHVLLGEWPVGKDVASIQVDPIEIQDYCWMGTEAIQKHLLENPSRYTPWFRTAFQLVLKALVIKQEHVCQLF